MTQLHLSTGGHLYHLATGDTFHITPAISVRLRSRATSTTVQHKEKRRYHLPALAQPFILPSLLAQSFLQINVGVLLFVAFPA
jgi:hypothetical protein